MMRRGLAITAISISCLLAGPALVRGAVLADAGVGSFSPGDLGHAIATLVIFGALFLILRKWAWGPIINQLRHREQSVADELDRAADREKSSQELFALYKERLDGSAAEGADILAQSRKDAAKAHEKVIHDARAQGLEMIERARQEIDQAKATAIKELRGSTADLAADIAGEVLRRNLDHQEHQRLIEQSLEQIRQHSTEGD